jgi:hypothetical protein
VPAKDLHHDSVVRALIKGGWRIISEQVAIILGERRLWIDIEAANTSDHRVILVEVKSFENMPSPVEHWAIAVGKYCLYRAALEYGAVEAPLFMAIPVAAYRGIVGEDIGRQVTAREGISLLVFDPQREEIIEWIP